MILKPKWLTKIEPGHRFSKGLVGAWLFNEGGGDLAYDYSGNGNHGTLVGDTYSVPGKFGPALEFDGAGDYVNLDNSVLRIEGLNEGTISGWFKSSSNTRQHIFTITRGSNQSDRVEVALWGSGGGLSGITGETFEFLVYSNTAALQMVLNGASYLDGVWYHFAVVTGGGENKIYIDGISQPITYLNGDSSTNEFSNINLADTVRIGTRRINDANGTFFNGQIDNVTIWDRALNAGEISDLYRDPFQMYKRNL